MNEAKIRIAYDGEALRTGAMNVRDLAPALMALSDLFEESNKVLNDKDSAVQLRVQSDFRTGSFDVGVQIVQTWGTKLLHLFATDDAAGLANLIGILGFGAAATRFGLIQLLKWLRGRPIRSLEIVDDNDVRIVIEGDQLVISRKLATIFNDVAIRRALAAMLEPLKREGVDTFQVRTETGGVVEQIDRLDLPFFEPPTPSPDASQTVIKNEFKQAFTLVSVAFKDGNKWRVSDGQNTINVTIEDADFLARVNNREESFTKDDTIVCTVRQEQTIASDGLKMEYAVTEVLEHKHAPRQAALPFTKYKPDPED